MKHFLCITLLVSLITTAFAAGDDWVDTYQPEDDSWKSVEQHFIFNSGADPETLDPHQITTSDAFRLADCMFEGLLSSDPKTLEPRPACAETMTVSDDKKSYTFILRDNLKWSDGSPLTVEQFAASFKRALLPETGAQYAYLLYHIQGAEEFHTGKTKDFSTVGIQVDPKARKLVLNLKAPCPSFPAMLSMPVFMPIRIDLIAKHDTAWTSPENLVCNGPFVLKERHYREKLVFVKNKQYRDASRVHLEKVTAYCYDDQNTAYKHFKNGDIHWLTAVPQNRIEEMKRQPDYYAHKYFGTYFYRFNVTEKPFDNALVRQAFVLATNRRAITDELMRGGQTPSARYCPPVDNYTPPEGLGYDVERAKKLLAEAGYADGKGLPPVELAYNKSEAHKMIAEALAQQWQRNLGIQVTTRTQEWKVFIEDMRNLRFKMARSSWVGDYLDPSTFYDCFHSTSGNNRTGWEHTEYDRLVEASRVETDPEKRLQQFRKLETILTTEECPILSIFQAVNQGLLAENVMGWYPNLLNYHPVRFIWMEP